VAFGQSRYLRQTEVRKRLGEENGIWAQRVRALLCWPVVVGFAFWAAATWTVLSGRSRLPYSINQAVQQPILSRVNFERINEN